MGRLLGSLVAGALMATAAVLTAPTAAAADRVAVTIPYSCDIPIFGTKTLNAAVHADIPATAQVGVPWQITNAGVSVPIPHDVYDTFTPFGATQADGTLDFELIVTAPGGQVYHLPIDGVIPITPLPNPSGPDMVLSGSGATPPITFTQAGTADVSAGPQFTVHFTPRDANGNPTILGTLVMPCTATGSTHMVSVSVS